MATLLRPTAVALVLAFALGVLGTQSVAFTDYELEAEPAAVALAAGHVERFAELAPAYGGSLVLRAPVALAAGALGLGDGISLYRALALPALLLAAGLGVVLWRRLRDVGAPGAWLALALAAANPLSMRALDYGHPEEVVGGVLCVAAVLLALRDRALAAGLVLGLAAANKPWAVLAALPVLLALDAQRGRCLLVAAGVCGLVMAPILLAGSAAHGLADVATARTTLFRPAQVFWFFGEHHGTVRFRTGAAEGFRTAPGWVQAISHPAIVVVGVGLALAWARRRRRDGVLALLALVLLTRCLLDTWDLSYYTVPFLLALLAHEVAGRGRAPYGTLVATIALWACLEVLWSPDAQAAGFLVVAGAAWGALALAAFTPERAARLTARAQGALRRRLPTLVGQPVSSATAARSSLGATVQP
jgi:Glycosyltransferase family 87